MKSDNYFMDEAIKEAKKSLDEGGIPIGAVLVKDGEIVSRGHNRLIQNDSVILNSFFSIAFMISAGSEVNTEGTSFSRSMFISRFVLYSTQSYAYRYTGSPSSPASYIILE